MVAGPSEKNSILLARLFFLEMVGDGFGIPVQRSQNYFSKGVPVLTPLRGGRQKIFILVGGDFDFRLPLCMGFVGLGSQAKFPKHVAQKYFSPLSASLEILRPSGRMNFFLGRDGLIISGGQGTSKHRRAYCPELHFACPTGGIGKANGGVKTLLLILNQPTGTKTGRVRK